MEKRIAIIGGGFANQLKNKKDIYVPHNSLKMDYRMATPTPNPKNN